MEANTCKNTDFCMPNYVLSKAATPMKSHFEIKMFTSKFFWISPCKTLSKYGAHSQIPYVPVPIFHTFCFEKTMHGKIDTRCEPVSFKVCCMLNPVLWRNPALSKTNMR